MNTNEQYFPIVLFMIVQYKVVLTFDSVAAIKFIML